MSIAQSIARSVARPVASPVSGIVGGGGGPAVDPFVSAMAIAAAVYSPARKLIAGYSGPCMKVTRLSDNAVADIGFSGGVIDIAAMAAHCAGSYGRCNTLYDQSGNSRHLVQATVDSQWYVFDQATTYKLNGKSVCWATGYGQALICPSGFTFTELSSCNVAQFTLDGAGLYQFGAAGVGGAMVRETTLQSMAHSADARASIAVALNTFHQMSATIAPALRRVWLDATEGTPSAVASALSESNAKLSVGSFDLPTTFRDMAGYFGDQVFWTSVISDAQRLAVQADQKLFWGTP